MEELEKTKTLTNEPVKFQMDFGFGQFFISILILGLFFVLPIQLVSNWDTVTATFTKTFSPTPQPQVAGIFTDNTGRYFNVPIINFKFDSTMRDPATISFAFGVILLVLCIVIVLVLFADFRKKEMKYR
jgi:Na+/phosphate symporter